MSFDLHNSSPKGIIQIVYNCIQRLIHKDVNCGFVYTFEKPETSQISSDGGIKQIAEHPCNKGLYNY